MGEDTPPAVWDNISGALDEQYAQAKARRNRLLLSSALVFLCFFTFTASLNLKENLASNYESSINTAGQNENFNISFFEKSPFSPAKVNLPSVASSLFVPSGDNTQVASAFPVDFFSDGLMQKKSGSSFLSWNKQQSFFFKYIPETSFAVDEEEFDQTQEKDEEEITESKKEEKDDKEKVRLPYVVASYLFSNNWLLNHDTFNAFGEKDLNHNKLTFAHNFGLGVGYALSPKIDIQADVLLKARNGQQYQAYLEGRSFEKRMRLTYTRAQVIVKKKKEIRADEKYFNLYCGAYYARLNSASATDVRTTLDVSSQYRKNDFGLLAGIELERKITKKLNLVTGVVASYGLSNAYAGTEYEPASFNKTHHFYTGINLGLKYQQ